MKEDNKKTVKKTVMAGAGTVTGAVVGSLVENALNPVSAEAVDATQPEILGVIPEETVEITDQTIPEAGATPIASHSVMEHPVYGQTPPADTSVEESVVIVVEDNHDEPEGDTETIDTTVEIEDTEIEPVGSMDPLIPVMEDSPEEDDTEDDIMVVNVTPDSEDFTEDSSHTIIDITADNYGMDAPDYLTGDDSDTKAGVYGIDTEDISSIDMPDYVNNANIDSFTEPA